MKKIKKLPLIPKLIMAVILGLLFGSFMPNYFNILIITLSENFGIILGKIIVPMMILAYVTSGIAKVNNKAGKLLAITTFLAYLSTTVMGSVSYMISSSLFPKFISGSSANSFKNLGNSGLKPIFEIPLKVPLIDVTAAIIVAFIFGLVISTQKNRKIGTALYDIFNEFSVVISVVLDRFLIPLLPLYICGTFTNMTASGQAFIILGMLWKVFLTAIILHLCFLFVIFCVAGIVSKKNPFFMMKNQIKGYVSAVATQSSAATIPVNLQCAKNNGVSEEIREFVIPLCSTIHLPGSMTTITCCVASALLLYDLPVNLGTMVNFIMILGIAMIAAPGAPGGGIMSATPFLPLVGIPSNGHVQALLVAMYLTQDSFGTACNVSGDNAIAVIMDAINKRFIKREKLQNSKKIIER